MEADRALVEQVRTALSSAEDPERARAQQAYMKSTMPFHGITAPQLRRILDPLLLASAPSQRAVWETTVRELWDGATHREHRYAALALAGHRSAAGWQDPDVLDLYRHLSRTGAWWDLVDETARLVGGVLAGHREAVTPVIRAWADDEDLWVRRVAILAQLKHKGGTDVILLEHCVAANLIDSRHGGEFFIRKALGWALREHAKTDPEWVRQVVRRYGDRLAPLTRREATKHLGIDRDPPRPSS